MFGQIIKNYLVTNTILSLDDGWVFNNLMV